MDAAASHDVRREALTFRAKHARAEFPVHEGDERGWHAGSKPPTALAGLSRMIALPRWIHLRSSWRLTCFKEV